MNVIFIVVNFIVIRIIAARPPRLAKDCEILSCSLPSVLGHTEQHFASVIAPLHFLVLMNLTQRSSRDFCIVVAAHSLRLQQGKKSVEGRRKERSLRKGGKKSKHERWEMRRC